MKKSDHLFYITVLIITGIVISLFFGIHKKGFHEDEYYSYYSTNYTNGWAVGDGGWIFSDRLYQEFVVLPGEEFNYSLVSTVQSWDVHPPMYYWILHTVCSFWKNTFTKWQGLTVNIFFYLYAIVFLYLSCIELIKDKNPLLAFSITLSYIFSSAVISGIMFIRMYMLLSALIISSVYFHLKLLKKEHLEWPVLVLCFINLYIGALSHYYFLIYHFFISAAVAIYLVIRDKKIKNGIIYGLSMLIAVALAVFTFPASISHLFSGYRGTEATQNFFDITNTFDRLRIFLSYGINYIFLDIILFIVVLILCILITYKNIKFEIRSFIIAVVTIGYYFVISKTGLLLGKDAVRYILPIFGLIYMLIASFIGNIESKTKVKSIFAVLIVAILLFADFINICNHEILFLYNEDEAKIKFAREHSNIPVLYIYQKDNSWRYVDNADELLEYSVLCFISDKNNEPILDDYINNCEELLVYIRNDYNIDEQIDRVTASNSKLDNYEIIFENKYCNLYYFN